MGQKVNVFSCSLRYSLDKSVQVTNCTNKQIPPDLLLKLNNAVQQAVNTYNNKSEYIDECITFTVRGTRYAQVVNRYGGGCSCFECCFKSGRVCSYPSDKIKIPRDCEGKHYITEY